MKRFSLIFRASLVALFVFSSRLPAQNQKEMMPFSMDHRRAVMAQSPVDVSFLLDAPAGKHGFIQVKDGHLATGDGKRIRFWGVNITDWSSGSRQIPAKQDAELWAATLARFGVNCVRFQFLDLEAPRGLILPAKGSTRALDPEQLDREDYFIAALEKRGIYIDFNLLVGRPFGEADGVKDAKLLREGAKGTSLFDARMIELQKEYAQQLLGHLNSYTKLKYSDDPGIAIVEINNENAINVGYRGPSPFYEDELTSLFNRWLTSHRSPQEIARLRSLAGVPVDQPDAAVPLLGPRGHAARAPAERFHAEAEFFDDLQRNYFADMKDYIQQTLGSKSLVMATADHSHSGSGYPILLAQSSMDMIDGHTYWQHPESYVRKSPMVNDPYNSTVVELSRSAVAGKPYTVSEVNNPFPNDYAGEGLPILAAYASLQDWDAILWYTFEPKVDPNGKPYIGDPFDISLDPVKMPELAAGALLFLRGDVAKGKSINLRSYSQQQVFDSMLMPTTERPYFTPGFPLDLPLEHEVRIASLTGAPTRAFHEAELPNLIVADTGELAWYTTPAEAGKRDGLVTVDTQRSQALIGFVRSRGKSVSNLAAKVDDSFCTLLLSSLDDQPIALSSRLLLVAGGPVHNTGQAWNAVGTDVTAWGGAPTLIEPVKGAITLRGLHGARSVLFQAIDGAGQPLSTPVKATASGDDWTASIGGSATTWYQISVTH
jgi:hypothetical protein